MSVLIKFHVFGDILGLTDFRMKFGILTPGTGDRIDHIYGDRKILSKGASAFCVLIIMFAYVPTPRHNSAVDASENAIIILHQNHPTTTINSM